MAKVRTMPELRYRKRWGPDVEPRTIRLSAAEFEVADWAIDPMEDYWEEKVRAGEEAIVPALPELNRKGRTMRLFPESDVIEDFLYRLEIQYEDMGAAGPELRASRGLAKKIRHAAMAWGIKVE